MGVLQNACLKISCTVTVRSGRWKWRTWQWHKVLVPLWRKLCDECRGREPHISSVMSWKCVGLCKSDDKRNKSYWGLGGLGEFRRRRVATRSLRTICCLICYFNACLVPCLYGLMRTSVLTAVPRPDDTHWAAARARFSCVSACDPLWLYPPGSRRRARFNTFPRRHLTPTSCGPIRHKNMSADRHSASLMAQCDSNVTRSGLIFMADHCNTCRPPGGADSPPVRPIKSNFRDTR